MAGKKGIKTYERGSLTGSYATRAGTASFDLLQPWKIISQSNVYILYISAARNPLVNGAEAYSGEEPQKCNSIILNVNDLWNYQPLNLLLACGLPGHPDL